MWTFDSCKNQEKNFLHYFKVCSKSNHDVFQMHCECKTDLMSYCYACRGISYALYQWYGTEQTVVEDRSKTDITMITCFTSYLRSSHRYTSSYPQLPVLCHTDNLSTFIFIPISQIKLMENVTSIDLILLWDMFISCHCWQNWILFHT